jgi:SAM-dependent methyltransferase
VCDVSCIIFGAINLTIDEVEGKRVIELGSCNVNGSLRPIIEALKPAEYVGVDIQKGPGVDVICGAENIIEKFGKESFSIIVSTELLEHVRDWRKVISNIKNICKPNGIILITTRSYGFSCHGYPYDFWRYELSDMENIFSDCAIEKLEKDRNSPGVFIKIRKPKKFIERDLSNYELYSIVTDKRVKDIDEKSFRDFWKNYIRSQFIEEKIMKLLSSHARSLLETIIR